MKNSLLLSNSPNSSSSMMLLKNNSGSDRSSDNRINCYKTIKQVEDNKDQKHVEKLKKREKCKEKVDDTTSSSKSCHKLEKFIESLQALLDQDSSSNKIMSKGVDLGVRVVRGPDWKWGDQDNGVGHIGTVIEIGRKGSTTSPDQTVVVQWDSGVRTNYRSGYQNSFDLRAVDNAPSGVRHPNNSCRICKSIGILGFRWSCTICADLDLCNPCYSNGHHDLNHAFKRHDTAHGVNSSVCPPRSASTRLLLKGIFPGAVVKRGPDWDWGNQDGGDGNIGIVEDINGWDEESGRSVVTVKWNATQTKNVYRLGHKGKVDIQFIDGRQAEGDYYYPDHLPVIGQDPMMPPIQQGTTTSRSSGGAIKFSVGDKVKVVIDSESLKSLQNAHGGYSPRMAEIIGKVGTIHRFTDKGDIRVQYSGRPEENYRWTLNPIALIKINTFDAGSIVRIIDDGEKVRRLQEGHGEWIETMVNALGKTGRVVKVYADGDLRVTVVGQTWTFNPLCITAPAPGSQTELNNRSEDHDAVRIRTGSTNNSLSENLHEQLQMDPLVSIATQGGGSAAKLDRLKEELKNVKDLKSVRYALQAAAHRGYLDIVKYLINQYPDEVDIKCGGKTALHVAAHQGQIAIVELLLNSGSNVATPDDDGDCAIHYAAFGCQPSTLDYLLSKSSNNCINIVNKKACSALHVSIIMKDSESVKILLKHKVDVNLQDSYDDTAFHEAINKNNEEILELLVNHPTIDFRLKNRRGFNCLQYAALKGNEFAVKAILAKARQLAEVKKVDGFSPLHLASLNGHTKITKILLEIGQCQVDVRDNRGQNPLHLAAGQGHASVVELLVSHALELPLVPDLINTKDSEGDTPLHSALGREGAFSDNDTKTLCPTIAEILRQVGVAGVHVNYQRGVAISLYLISHGANVTSRNSKGFSPLDLINNDAIAKSLLSNKTSVLINGSSAASTLSPSKQGAIKSPATAQDPIICKICDEESKFPLTFQPCGHRLFCRECGERMKKCLECKTPIDKKLGGYWANNKSIHSSPDSSNSDAAAAARVNALEAKVRDLEDQYVCMICMERRKNVAFSCGHSACRECVETLRSCHICRGSVDKKINLY